MRPPGVDKICVVIGRTRHRMIQVEIQEAARRGARMIELRLDFLAKAPDFKRLLATKPCPLVATVRRREDGGRWNDTEEARCMLLRQAIVAGFDWVDLETDIAGKIARFRNVKRIISYHNLEEVPTDLEEIHQRMCEQDADVVKLAVCAQRPEDNLRVLSLLAAPPVPTVAFCLGDMGFPSRILAGKYGAPFTYAAFNKERTISLGIPSFHEMKNIFHYQDIGPETQLYGVVGDPVGHSISPFIYNLLLKQLGLNAVYIPFRVPRGYLPGFLKSFDRVSVRGYSVTVPHKEAALVAAERQDAAASMVGAANTLVRVPDGFAAYNTDYQAARDSLLTYLPRNPSGAPGKLDGRSVLVLGAGGVARAVARAVHREGGVVTITSRTPERSQQLAEEVGCRLVPWESRHDVSCAVLINCTPTGMHPNVDEMPVHPSFLTSGMSVFDVVYNPESTLLIKEARARGCHTLTGVDMFVRQAELQFGILTNRDPPADSVRPLVKRALSPITVLEEDA
jgi:3-dehydroquinate dehydratase / shikimate dehydrogenase